MSERRVHPSFGVEGPCSGACFPARGHTCCVRGSDVNFNRVQSVCMYVQHRDDDVTAPASQGLGVGVGRAGLCPRRLSWAGPAGGIRTGWTGRWPRPAGWPMLTVCAHHSDFVLLLPAAPPDRDAHPSWRDLVTHAQAEADRGLRTNTGTTTSQPRLDGRAPQARCRLGCMADWGTHRQIDRALGPGCLSRASIESSTGMRRPCSVPAPG